MGCVCYYSLFHIIRLTLKAPYLPTSRLIFDILCSMSAGRMGLSNRYRISTFGFKIMVVLVFLLHFFNLSFLFSNFSFIFVSLKILSFICKKPEENTPWEPLDIGTITPTANRYKVDFNWRASNCFSAFCEWKFLFRGKIDSKQHYLNILKKEK